MILLLEILFIILLTMILFAIYRNERQAAMGRLQHAKVEEYWGGKERRQHLRFKRELDVTYKVTKKPHLVNTCKTVDVSEGGLKLCLEEKLLKGTILDLKIFVPNAKRTAEVEGEVVWSDDIRDQDPYGKRHFHSGIKFCTIREPSGASLIDYIRSLGQAPGD